MAPITRDMGILDIAESVLTFAHNPVPGVTVPWWAAIVGTTWALRSCTLPLAVIQRRRLARLRTLGPIMKGWEATLLQRLRPIPGISKPGEVPSQNLIQRQYKEKLQQLYKQYDCHPIRTFILPWAQIPLFVTMSLTIRRMSGLPLPSFLDPAMTHAVTSGLDLGGALWFVNLLQPDPTLVFPVFLGAVNYFNIEVNRLGVPLSGNQRVVHFFFRILALTSIPIATQIPMALTVYWTASSTFSLFQNIFLMKLGAGTVKQLIASTNWGRRLKLK
ncbi:membrane insertase OXA1/ALB3/YidC [Cladochytrium replicatum]|nr:membrane insertase OXA1/ALB3/YidC [Cladochytrium replicatum]